MSAENIPVELTVDHLQKIFGISNASDWHSVLWPYMKKYDITTTYRISMFFGNLSVESNNFKTLVENLNYSAEGLRKTFPSKFAKVSAESYARNPQKIANYVYANKNGNGSEASGDGWKYRGQGLIQLTGKGNVAAFHRKEPSFNALSNPEVLQQKPAASASACWFWSDKGLNRQADSGNWAVCVKRINAASLHMEERTTMYKRALSVLLGKEVEELPESTGSSTDASTPDSRISGVTEPRGKAAPQYPHNKVYQSPSGHCIEVDDTPGAERIMIFHMSGSYIEMHMDGDVVIKAHKDLYLLAGGSVQKLQKEDQAEIVEGQSYEKVGQKVMSNDQMTVESSDLQVNAPSAFSKPMDAKEINSTDVTAAELTCTAPVAQLNAATAEVAKFANAFAPGSAAGMSLANLSKSIQIETDQDGGSKQIKPDAPLNVANGMFIPRLEEMPTNYSGFFVYNDVPYLGMGNQIIPLGAQTTSGDNSNG